MQPTLREDFGLDRYEVSKRCGLRSADDLARMSPSQIYQQVAGVEA